MRNGGVTRPGKRETVPRCPLGLEQKAHYLEGHKGHLHPVIHASEEALEQPRVRRQAIGAKREHLVLGGFERVSRIGRFEARGRRGEEWTLCD